MSGKLGRVTHRILLLALASLVILAESGCTRRFFRKCADTEVAAILNDKDQFPEWRIENYHVYADPRARFADPTNPDRPPMPPDDPAAQWLGPNPQRPCKAGIARIESDAYMGLLAQWDADNRALRNKNSPDSMQSSAADSVHVANKQAPKGNIQQAVFQAEEPDKYNTKQAPMDYAKKAKKRAGYLLRLDQAVELGLINSREYQARREDLYLTALPVTSERFAFGPQAFAVQEAIREHTGKDTATGHGDRWRANSTLGVTKLFSTGALLLIGYANRTVIELTNPSALHTTSIGTLNLDIAQPLLRGGGRAVTLEPLTQAERNLLYEIRDYARFRKEYYQYISAGGLTVRAGTASFGGRGLSPGSISLGSGNPARPEILPGGAGRLDLGIASVATAEGFFPTLLDQARLKNEYKNEQFLQRLLTLFKAIEEGGDVSALQVDQVELRLLQSQSSILQLDQTLSDSLDGFNLQLGLPTNIPLELDDEVLQPITRQLEQYERVIQQYDDIVKLVEKSDNPAEGAKLRGMLQKFLTDSPMVQQTKTFKVTFPQRWNSYKKLDDKGLNERLDKERAERRKLLEEQAKVEADQAKLEEKHTRLVEKGQMPSKQEQEQLGALNKTLGELGQKIDEVDGRLRVGIFEFSLRRYEQKPKDPGRFRDIRNAFVLVLSEATSELMTLLRATWPDLPPVTVDGMDLLHEDLDSAYEMVSRTALANRLDLMNERARMNDSWRQIAIFANTLLGVFNVGYHMDTSTPPGEAKPLAFAPSRARHQLFLNAELPLVRLAERNSYRASLIAYQRARRNLMEAEDRIVFQIRNDLRQVRSLAENFKIQQRSVELQYQQVENSLETLIAPPDPQQAVRGSAGNAAALTDQLLRAQSGLLQNQNQLYQIWLNYLTGRQRLYLDLELMPLDPRGVWIDEYTTPQPPRQPPQPVEPAGSLPPVAQRDSARSPAEKTQTLR